MFVQCDGDTPCSNCAVSGHECIYQTDHRTKTYKQAVLAETNQKTTELDRLLEGLRKSCEADAVQIFRAVRSGADVPTALQVAERLNPQSTEASSKTVQDGYAFTKLRESCSALYLNNITQPFDKTSTGLSSSVANTVPWTMVTQNPEVINHILNLYFTYHHPVCPVIPESLIRDDMANGRTRYCSPTLINAILAVGCTLLGNQDEVNDRIDHWPSVDAFFNETERLLAAHPGPSLTAVAALSLLAMIDNLHLRYQRACSFSARASCMALLLGLHMWNVSDKGRNMVGTERRTFAAVGQQLFWVCFQVDQISSSNAGWQPQIVIDAIDVGLPSIEGIATAGLWTPCPTPGPSRTPGDPNNCTLYLAELAKVVNSTLIQSRSLSVDRKKVEIRNWESKYRTWYSRLPSAFAISESTPAHITAVHMWYHGSLIQLYRPILALGGDEASMAHRICQDASKMVTDLFSYYRDAYGLRGVNAIMCQALFDAYTIRLDWFPPPLAIQDMLIVVQAFKDLCTRQQWAQIWLERLESQTLRSRVARTAAVVEALFGSQSTTSKNSMLQERAPRTIRADSNMSGGTELSNKTDEGPQHLETMALRLRHRKDDYFFSPFARHESRR